MHAHELIQFVMNFDIVIHTKLDQIIKRKIYRLAILENYLTGYVTLITKMRYINIVKYLGMFRCGTIICRSTPRHSTRLRLQFR